MTFFISRYYTSKAITLYVVLLCVCSMLFFNRILPFRWIFFGVVEVVGFFYFFNLLTKRWNSFSAYGFRKKLFRTALIIRVFYVIFSYLFYSWMTGRPFEYEAADAVGYHEEAVWLLELIRTDQLDVYRDYIKGNYSDTGYVAYLTLIYSVFGKNLLLIRLVKALLSAYTCVLVFKIAERNFGEPTAKIAGILALLLPNLIYYCGLHLKETEMVFLTVLFFERADFIIRERKIKPLSLVLTLCLGVSLFFFRTVLAVTALFSFMFAFLLSPHRTLGIGKKLGLAGITLALLIFLKGGALESEIARYWGARDSNQVTSMQARSKGSAGNSLSTYGSAMVFAPIMLAAPFPTLVNVETQQNQMLMNGGYFTRNVYVFFLLVSLVTLIKNKKIRNHWLLVSFLFSYLAVLSLSKFAISERFHMPALPFIAILSAYGIVEMTDKSRKYYIPYLIVVFMIIVGWNYFKLAGRGVV